MTLELSPLPKTWLVDIDGTILVHNGHLHGGDRLLPGVVEFFEKIPSHDCIILMSARAEEWRAETESMLRRAGIRWDHLLFGLPVGERLLINDRKPSGLATAHAINLARDEGLAGLFDEIVVGDL